MVFTLIYPPFTYYLLDRKHTAIKLMPLRSRHTPVKITTALYVPYPYPPLSVDNLNRLAPIGPARTFPRPFPKQNRLNIDWEAEGSALIAETILAHIAVYPAPKNPYKSAKKMRGVNERATPQVLNVAVAATVRDTIMSIFNDNFLSER